jgi:hypothetical protein
MQYKPRSINLVKSRQKQVTNILSTAYQQVSSSLLSASSLQPGQKNTARWLYFEALKRPSKIFKRSFMPTKTFL